MDIQSSFSRLPEFVYFLQANSGRQLAQPLSTVSTNQAKIKRKVKTINGEICEVHSEPGKG